MGSDRQRPQVNQSGQLRDLASVVKSPAGASPAERLGVSWPPGAPEVQHSWALVERWRSSTTRPLNLRPRADGKVPQPNTAVLFRPPAIGWSGAFQTRFVAFYIKVNEAFCTRFAIDVRKS